MRICIAIALGVISLSSCTYPFLYVKSAAEQPPGDDSVLLVAHYSGSDSYWLFVTAARGMVNIPGAGDASVHCVPARDGSLAFTVPSDGRFATVRLYEGENNSACDSGDYCAEAVYVIGAAGGTGGAGGEAATTTGTGGTTVGSGGEGPTSTATTSAMSTTTATTGGAGGVGGAGGMSP